MKTRLLVSLLLAPLAFTACTDAQDAKQPTEVTAPALKRSVTGAEGDSTAQLSSVCLAYRAELQEYQAALAANPADVEAQQSVAVAQVRFTDACE